MTDAVAEMDRFIKKLIATGEAVRMAGTDLAIAVQALKSNAKNADVFAYQALQQWQKTLIAIEADRLSEMEKPLRIPLRIVSTSKEHLHADLETLDHEHRS